MTSPDGHRQLFDADNRRELLDKCGIFAILAASGQQLFKIAYPAIVAMRNRGQDGAGFELRRDRKDTLGEPIQVPWSEFLEARYMRQGLGVRGTGRVSEVFTEQLKTNWSMDALQGHMMLWQLRYGTSGEASLMNAQPVVCIHAMSGEEAIIGHNGSFQETAAERQEAASDTVNFSQRLAVSRGSSWTARIVDTLWDEEGAYSLLIAVPSEDAVYVVRDPRGFRPLYYAKHYIDGEVVWVAASETHALNQLGVANEVCTPVPAGVVLKLVRGQEEVEEVARLPEKLNHYCSFEPVYLQRKESLSQTREKMTPVEELRKRCGERMAELESIRADGLRPKDVDVVIGVPGTAIPGGRGFAAEFGVEYAQPIMDRDADDVRTFQLPQVEKILQKVMEHYHIDEEAVRGKRVVLVDDSLVRGNVSLGLTRLLKEVYGAAEVHWRILSPMVADICRFGVNTRSKEELHAHIHNGDLQAMCEAIGADSLQFLPLEDLSEIVAGNRNCDGICTACWVGGTDPLQETPHNEIKLYDAGQPIALIGD